MITTDYKPVKYSGDGVQKQFNVTFKFPRESDIKCTLKDSLGNITELSYNSDYTISNVNPTGPTYARANLTVAPASGTEVFIFAESLIRQETQYKNTGDFNLPVVEKNLDDLTLYLQQLLDELSRVVKVDITSDKNPAAIISDIEKLAANVATDVQKVQQALTQLFQMPPQYFTTTPGQLEYTLDHPVDTNLYNLMVILGGVYQDDGVAYTLTNSNTIRFAADPGAQGCTIRTSLSYANPDIQAAINRYLASAEQALETYSSTNVKPPLDAKVTEATAQADRAKQEADNLAASNAQIVANKNSITTLQSDQSKRISFPDWNNVAVLPTTVNLVQHVTEDCFLMSKSLQSEAIQISATNASGDIIIEFANSISSTGTNQMTLIPLKADTYFKVTYKASTPELWKVGVV